MKRVLLTLLAALLLCVPSLAQDLNFSAFEKPNKVYVNLSTASTILGYKEACEIAKKTKQVIWVVRDVENDTEVQAACEKSNGLFVNADGDTDFNVGLSKLESIGSKILYTEMPPSAFPDKPQNRQYVINRDVDRAEAGESQPKVATSASGKVSVPKTAIEIDPYAQPRWDANGIRTTGTQPVWRYADGTIYQGQIMQQSFPIQGGFMDGGFGGGFQGGSCGPGG